jgi:hypothetical protein
MEYLIKQNKHYSSGLHISLHSNIENLSFNFRFTKSCWYDIAVYGDHVNKLYGVSKRLFPKIKDNKLIPGHHHNSVRIGWSPAKELNKINLFAYFYDKGVRNIVFLDKIETDTVYKAEFSFTNGLFMVKVKSMLGYTRGIFSKQITWANDKWSYLLFPYFGGNPKSPCDMTIYITNLIAE